MKIKLSIVVCTYNGEKLLERCLNSILSQKYKNFEIICVDGGSTDRTIEIVKNYMKRHKNIKLLNNKKKFPEGYRKGKWLGYKNAKGKVIAFIDQDNELQGEDWLSSMMKFLDNPEVFAGAYRLMVNKEDEIVNRYMALMGNDPLLFYRSLDGIINLKKMNWQDKKDYYILKLEADNMLVTGGNCFFYKKQVLDLIGGYTKDTENVYRAVKKGHNKIIIPKNLFTHHLATSGFFNFIKKRSRWARTYEQEDHVYLFSWLPRTRLERREFIKNLFSCFFIIPNTTLVLKKYIKTKEKAWLLHPILAFLTGLIYFNHVLLRR